MDYEQEETEVDGVTYYGSFNTRQAYTDGYRQGEDEAAPDDDIDEVADEAARQYCAGSIAIRYAFWQGYRNGWKSVLGR